MLYRNNLPSHLAHSRILDSREAAAVCGFSLAHFRRLYRTGRVPRPIKIGERKLGWKADLLIMWLEMQGNASGSFHRAHKRLVEAA